MATNTRYDFLDWLRAIAIFVLLFFHTGMLFVGWDFHIQNREIIPALAFPMDIAHRLRMPLLFVIAGAGVYYALQRRTAFGVVRERTLRLMLPVVFGMFVIVPPQLFIERVFHGQWHGGFLDFYLHRVLQFQPYPAGNFSWHHLWFIVYLFAYVLISLPLFVWWSKRQAQPAQSKTIGAGWLTLLAVPLALNEALLKPLFPETHNLVHDWYLFFHYLLLTLSGFFIASMRGMWDRIAAMRFVSLASAVAIICIVVPLFNRGVIHRGTPVDAVIANVFTWLSILAFLGYGRRYLSFGNEFLRWAREAAYPVYILHQTLLLIIAYRIIQLDWSPWTKYWVVLAGTLLSSVALYQFAIRPFSPVRVLFGLKAANKRNAGTVPAEPSTVPASS
jgi:surface polysaccharide O-acyltransferase-like enzyme